MFMRTSRALRLLADANREHARERESWVQERERLLDRIMLLAEKPLLPDYGPRPEPEQPDDDVFFPDDNFDMLRVHER